MSESLFNIIQQQNEELNQTDIQDENKNIKTKKTQQINCNIAWCKTCHQNPRILSTKERIQISKKMEHKFKRLKICKNDKCLYCIKKTQDLNKKIEEHNQRVKLEREQEQKRNRQNSQQIELEMIEEQNENNEIDIRQIKEPNIEDFNKIDVTRDKNSLLRALLLGLNLDENSHPHLRTGLSSIIEENNYNNDLLNKLNYENSIQLAEEVRLPDNMITHDLIVPLCYKYNLICKIYLENSEYKGNKWTEIRNEAQDIKNQEIIFVSCYEGERPDLEGHYDLLIPKKYNISTPKTTKEIKELITKIKNLNNISSQINIMIWNCDSLSNYTKRTFLLEQLYTNDIQLCLLQETMLKKTDKLYMKGYKIYRADNSERRKGVAFLISNELKSLNQITEKDETNGRYIQIKITADDNTNNSILFNNIYIEPDQENNKEIIPQSIWQSEHIAGDMNKTNTGFAVESNVYHIKNMGKKITKINIPKIISDHPMLIYQMNIPIPYREQYEQIELFDKTILTQNNEEIKKLTQNNNYIPTFKNPIKKIKRKIHSIKFTNENYTENFNELKEKEKEKFKELKKRKAEEINQLLELKQLGSEPYQRLTSLMQIGTKIVWFKPESNTQKDRIIKGFKELYHHERIIKCTKENISAIFLQQLEIITKIPNITSIKCPKKPKSTARDINGISQRELWEHIQSENLQMAAYKLAQLIQNVTISQTGETLIHRTSKIILKKKKDFIESWKDVRPITIMPALFMVTDKITNAYLKIKLQPLIYNHQHGARTGMSTATAKMNLLYTLQKESFKYSLLLDLEKAFDKVNRTKLKQEINNTIIDQEDKSLISLILESYQYINMSLLDSIIQPNTGIPQGSVYGPILFLIYINGIFTALTKKHPTVVIQAFVDDIIISAKSKQDLERALNTAHELLEKLDMTLNLKKCEFLSDLENETITDHISKVELTSTLTVKYLGQYIDSEGNTTNIINRFDYGTINSLIKNNINHISRRAKVKLFNTYIKSKFSHLLPLITITGQLEKTWNNIRKTIFRDVIEFSTFPKESSIILGLSFYSIIIKPLLKIHQKEKKISIPEHVSYFQEACKIAFKLWLQKEPNNTESVKLLIEDFLVNNKFHELEEYENIIYKESAKRLYRNQQIPDTAATLAKSKLPRVLEISSNAPTHFIEGIIKSYILNKKEIDIQEIKKNIAPTIAQYVLIQNIGGFNINDIDYPDPNDLKQLIEYQQLYDLKIQIELDKYITQILSTTEEIINEIIKTNKNNISNTPLIPNNLQTIITQVRNGIPLSDKNKLFMIECSLEKFEQKLYQEIKIKTNKRKIGRPKKNNENNKMDAEISGMIKFLGLDKN